MCIRHLTTAIEAVDDILTTRVLARGLKALFGLEALDNEVCFMWIEWAGVDGE